MSAASAGARGAPTAAALYAVAERENPKRRFLFVSRVLGKHLPVDPRVGRAAGAALALVAAGDARADAALEVLEAHDGPAAGTLLRGLEVRPARPADHAPLAGDGPRPRGPAVPPDEPVSVLGFAETATALGLAVADALGADLAGHTTRRAVAGAEPLRFVEEHSHAPDQWLFAAPPAGGTTVVVDDEMTTGRTTENLVRALHAARPAARYVCLALIDRLGEEGRARLRHVGHELGATVEVVSLRSCTDAELPADDAPAAGATPVPRARAVAPLGPAAAATRDAALVPVPGEPATTGRLGLDRAGRARLHARGAADAARLADALRSRAGGAPGPVRVLGFGEYLHQPMATAAALAERLGEGADVRFWSTTRSPVRVAGDAAPEGYPIAAGLAFPLPEEPETPGFVYSADRLADAAVVLCPERAGDLDAAGPLVAEVRAAGAARVLALVPAEGTGA